MIALDMQDNAATIVLEDEVTVQHAEELKDMLLDTIKNVEELTIDVSGLTQTDVTCLQLLCSAEKTALEMNKQLNLTGKNKSYFSDMASIAGFSNLVRGK